MKRRLACLPVVALLLGGCGADDHADLRAFMAETGRDGGDRVAPLPALRQPDDFEYTPAGLEDPFKPHRLQPSPGAGGPNQTDLARKLERLETFPLDALRMTGILIMRDRRQAVVRDPEGKLHRVGVGARIGQNFGVVTAVHEDRLEIREVVQDSAGNWVRGEAVLAIQGRRN
jgi:type IV pilus assembly protein PilP